LLGLLGNELEGGKLNMQDGLSDAAIKNSIADPLGLEVPAAAESILDIANANMADAVRLDSVRRGLDPRDFALVAFGGAGALHGADVAMELDITTVIVTPSPGVTSAQRCLPDDIQPDLSQLYTESADDADNDRVQEQLRELELEGRPRLRHEKVAEEDAVFQRGIAMRYQGQWRSLQVKMGSGPNALEDAVQLFHEEHEKHYAFRQDETPVEIYQLHL